MLRLHKLISRETMFKVYMAFIVPHVHYCSTVWHFCWARNTEKLDTLNKRILRFILKDYSSPYSQFLDKVNLTSLRDKQLQSMFIVLYKSLFVTDYLNYMRDMFTLRAVNYNLSGYHILSLPKPRTTTYGLNLFRYHSAKLWNALPEALRACKDFDEFKRNVRNFYQF